MLIGDLFDREVTREIPPVIYFHEQRAEALAREVAEYIVTGGYPKGDHRATPDGIHEQFIRLLAAIRHDMEKKTNPGENPGVWISGFFGSGKSSFAKLLGLALDGRTLPDGRSLADALLAQDLSPDAAVLRKEWQLLLAAIPSPISVVFDVGSNARENEQVHSVVIRQVQRRFGYSSSSQLVAEMELALETENRYEAFLEKVLETRKKPWSEEKDGLLAEDICSTALHALDPKMYPHAQAWVDARIGRQRSYSADEVVRMIQAMLLQRFRDRTLFLVIDEVSQYVHDDTKRMLALQSFISALGQQLHGRAWVLATGQQQLEASAGPDAPIVKMKDRFPSALRVHLGTANIREVVYKRLLRKKKHPAEELAEDFRKHRADLALYAYDCEDIKELDFVEVYPMLPGHIELLLDITSGLRMQSERAQTDAVAIRGLLQLLGDLFREKDLARHEVGRLITLDLVYDILATALGPDVQRTIGKGLELAKKRGDELMARVLKAVAMLELVQDAKHKTTAELVARCLYERLGAGDNRPCVQTALDALVAEGVVGSAETRGYRIESTAGQDWQDQRERYSPTAEQQSERVRTVLAELMNDSEKVSVGGVTIPWLVLFSDDIAAKDARLKDERKPTVITLDLRFTKSTSAEHWVVRSDASDSRDRLFWVVGDIDGVRHSASKLVRSERMCTLYANKTSLSPDKQRLAIEEGNRMSTAQRELTDAVKAAFMDGRLYFRSRETEPRTAGSTFASALSAVANRISKDLYPDPTLYAVSEKDALYLIEKTELTAPPTVFGQDKLGLLSLDANRYELTCNGRVPTAILAFVSDNVGVNGGTLIAHFGGPPHGVAPDVVRAVVLALLRASKVRVELEGEGEITSVREQGARDLLKESSFRKARITKVTSDEIEPRGRNRICAFFKEQLGKDIARENDAIAEAVSTQFAAVRGRLTKIEALFRRLPKGTAYPKALSALEDALVRCMRYRNVKPTVVEVERSLDALRDGVNLLRRMETDLTSAAIESVAKADDAYRLAWPGLAALGASDAATKAAKAIAAHLKTERPWEDPADLELNTAKIRDEARERRRTTLTAHESASTVTLDRLKRRAGFDKLDDAQRMDVLRVWEQGVAATTDEHAIAPALDALDALLARARDDAERKSNALLDTYLHSAGGAPVVEVKIELSGRELETERELDEWLGEVRSRVMHEISARHRVRLRGV